MDCLSTSIPILKALCDETRLRILSLLADRSMNGCEINRAFDCSQPTISYHMKLLVDAGLVLARKEGCAVIYTIDEEIWLRVRALMDVLCTAANRKGDIHD